MCTPFFAVHGRDPRMSFVRELKEEQDHPHLDADQIQATIEYAQEYYQVEMPQSQAVQEAEANHGKIPALNVQEAWQAWLEGRHIWTTRPKWKLDSKHLGPVKVLRQVSLCSYEFEFPASIPLHQVQPVLLLDTAINDPSAEQRVSPPPAVEVDSEEEYQVVNVENSWIYQSQLQYTICWTGYNSLTWEPSKFVDGLEMVGEFD